MCYKRPKDRDRFLNAVLFAYREVPQENSGFSPFELLYCSQIRGPVAIVRELWAGASEKDEVKTTYQYVVELKQMLEQTCKLVFTSTYSEHIEVLKQPFIYLAE